MFGLITIINVFERACFGDIICGTNMASLSQMRQCMYMEMTVEVSWHMNTVLSLLSHALTI